MTYQGRTAGADDTSGLENIAKTSNAQATSPPPHDQVWWFVPTDGGRAARIILTPEEQHARDLGAAGEHYRADLPKSPAVYRSYNSGIDARIALGLDAGSRKRRGIRFRRAACEKPSPALTGGAP